MRVHSRAGWIACYGVLGTLVGVGAGTLVVRDAAAFASARDDAQHAAQSEGQPTPQPSGAGNQLAQGRSVFDHVCGRCHPNGEEDVGPRIANKNWDEQRVLKQIRNGTGRMRAIPPTKLPDANIPALMAYLRTLHVVR